MRCYYTCYDSATLSIGLSILFNAATIAQTWRKFGVGGNNVDVDHVVNALVGEGKRYHVVGSHSCNVFFVFYSHMAQEIYVQQRCNSVENRL